MTFVLRKDGQVEKYITTFLQYKTMLTDPSPECDRYESYRNMPISPKHNKIFTEITNFYNVPVTYKRQKYIWNGKELDVTQTPSFHCMMHEVGHFLMCPKEYRTHIDYGLGSPTFGGVKVSRPDGDDHVEEDILASIFGIYLEFLVGDDIEITIGDVGVDDQLTHEFLSECFQHYYDLGIIDQHGTPFNGTNTLVLEKLKLTRGAKLLS